MLGKLPKTTDVLPHPINSAAIIHQLCRQEVPPASSQHTRENFPQKQILLNIYLKIINYNCGLNTKFKDIYNKANIY